MASCHRFMKACQTCIKCSSYSKLERESQISTSWIFPWRYWYFCHMNFENGTIQGHRAWDTEIESMPDKTTSLIFTENNILGQIISRLNVEKRRRGEARYSDIRSGSSCSKSRYPSQGLDFPLKKSKRSPEWTQLCWCSRSRAKHPPKSTQTQTDTHNSGPDLWGLKFQYYTMQHKEETLRCQSNSEPFAPFFFF